MASSGSPELRAALLLAVDEIVRESGLTEVSLREVARRAGVSHQAPGFVFGNKARMLTAYATDGYARLAAEISDEFGRARPATGPAMLEAVGRGYVAFALRYPAQFGMMFRMEHVDGRDQGFREAADQAWILLTTCVDRCIAEGSVIPEDREVAMLSAWSLVHGLAELWLSGRLRDRIAEPDPTVIARLVTSWFVSGALGRPARPSASPRSSP